MGKKIHVNGLFVFPSLQCFGWFCLIIALLSLYPFHSCFLESTFIIFINISCFQWFLKHFVVSYVWFVSYLCPLVMILFTIHGCIIFSYTFWVMELRLILVFNLLRIVGCGWGHDYLLHLVSTFCHVHM